ncbi:hypothetical protein CN465_06130 [Bacillus cereus]|nr:hypothetical protein CN465_06130 [Bacillus cereus]PGP67271.1 hypothetical protein CN998_19215 [Bacillus cereus]
MNMGMHFVAPEYKEKVFTCPHCNATAKQHWSNVQKLPGGYVPLMEGFYGSDAAATPQWELHISVCDVCGDFLLWYNEERIYPLGNSIENPIDDMPEDVMNLYNEARDIVQRSPKSACALLRLALEKVLVHLGYPKNNRIVDNINKLKKDGKVDEYVHAALESVRLVGNNAVHPGKIDIDDNPQYAYTLFKLLNYIVDELIARPKRAKAFRESIR